MDSVISTKEDGERKAWGRGGNGRMLPFGPHILTRSDQWYPPLTHEKKTAGIRGRGGGGGGAVERERDERFDE